MGTWYRTGTVSVVNGSKTVMGVGTQWVENAVPGSILKTADGMFEVDEVMSAVSITLVENYTGATASGLAYAIIPTQGYIPPLSRKVNELVEQTGAVKDAYASGELLTSGVLEATDGANKVGTADGRSVQDRFDDLTTEVDAAGTAQAKVSSHNTDANAHPAMTEFISSEVDRAEAAANAAVSGVGLPEFPSRAAGVGVGGVPNGDLFIVLAGNDGLTRTSTFKNNSGVALLVVDPVSGTEFDDLAGPDPTMVPQVMETTDPALQSTAVVLDADGRIIGQVPDPRVPALMGVVPVGGYFETTILYGTLLLDADRRVLASLGEDGSLASVVALLAAEIAGARGNQSSVGTRLDHGLTPYGDALGAFANRASIREARMRLRKLKLKEAIQFILAFIGDSYTHLPTRYMQRLAKTLQDEYGFAGVGYLSFSWHTNQGSGPWSVGVQPSEISKDGCVRPDIVPAPTVIGNWSCAYNAPANNTPSIGSITSTTPGDYVRFTIPYAGDDGATPTPSVYQNAARLFYTGSGTGVVAVSYDDGATYGADVPLATVGAANVLLTAPPAIGATCRIKVVSGTVTLGGVDLQSTAPGVRIHKLGGSGSRAQDWAGVTSAKWAAQMQALGPHLVHAMLATNDQTIIPAAPTLPATFATYLATIFNSIKSVLPYSDRVIVMPPENQRLNVTVPMVDYTRAAREYAMANDTAFMDLQPFFGSPANNAFDYAWANTARQWYAADLVHPVPETGGTLIVDAEVNLLTRT